MTLLVLMVYEVRSSCSDTRRCHYKRRGLLLTTYNSSY